MPAPPTTRIESLALALGTGTTLAEWCRKHDVIERTARRWAADPKFKAKVNAIRQRLIEATVGRLAEAAPLAVNALVDMIADPLTAAGDRRQAANAILGHLPSLAALATQEQRIAALEEVIRNGGGIR